MGKIQVLAIVLVLIIGCSSKPNTAQITLNQTNTSEKTIKQFPVIPDILYLDTIMATYCSGSHSEIFLECKTNIQNSSYLVKINLPAGEKLRMRDRYEKGVEFSVDTFPFTISGNDYCPYANVLDKSIREPLCTIEVFNKETRSYDFMSFVLDKLIIHQLQAENNHLFINIDYYGISTSYPYGKHSAIIKLNLKNINLDQLLVD